MSNACDTCGYRSSDIKAGGGVSDKGTNIILDVSEQEDLRRDVIKAESASISIPEADLEVTTGKADQNSHSLLRWVPFFLVSCAVSDSVQSPSAAMPNSSFVISQSLQFVSAVFRSLLHYATLVACNSRKAVLMYRQHGGTRHNC